MVPIGRIAWPLCVIAVLSAPLAAQGDTDNDRSRKNEHGVSIYAMSKVKGLQVWSFDRQKIGKIEDVVIDTMTGRIDYAVIEPSIDGVEGSRDVPYKQLIVKKQGDECVASLKREDLQRAQKSDESENRRSHRFLASAVIGKSVLDAKGESLGEIEELYLDPGHRMVAYAAVGMGGVLGIGESLHMVPYRAIGAYATGDGLEFVLDMPRDTLKAMPHYSDGNLPKLDDVDWNRTTHGLYALPPYWEFTHGLLRVSELRGCNVQIDGMEDRGEVVGVIMSRSDKPCHLVVSWPNQSELLVFPAKRLRAYRYGDELHLRLHSGTTMKDAKRVVKDGWKKSIATLAPDAAGTAALVPAEDVVAHSFVGSAGEALGEIEDLLIAPEDGTVRYAIAGVGGVLGVGEAQHVIPWARVTCTADGKCTASISEAQLKRAPVFKKTDWKDVDDTALEEVDLFYEQVTVKP